MRRVFKLAVVVGGIGAMAWGMRKRFRVAIGRSGAVEPDFHISELPPEDPDDAPEDPDDADPHAQDGAR